MKTFIVFAAIVAVSYGSLRSSDLQEYYNSLAEHEDPVTQLKLQIERICPGWGDTFTDSVLGNITECTQTVDEASETMCSIVKNHFKRCAQPLTDMFEACLPKKIYYLPEMVTDITTSVVKAFCESTGEEIAELSNRCVWDNSYKSRRCSRMAYSNVRKIQNRQYPTKQELCEQIDSSRICLESAINHSCGNIVTRRSIMKFLDAFQTPCKSQENSIGEYEILEK